MASPALKKLLRNQSQSAVKILTFLRQPIVPTRITEPYDPSYFSNHPKTDCLKPEQSFDSHVYPSFPFGFFLDPVSPARLVRSEPDGETTADDESSVIRADSVKKKRKKKMNKHKLKKLRKRLRRKT